MWQIVPSVQSILQPLSIAFTEPSFQTHLQIFIGWVMCLGKRTEYRVFETIEADIRVSRAERHPFDRFYNFFNRAVWEVEMLAYALCKSVVLELQPTGMLYLIVDDTLLHKQGKKVYGLGWFRDAVASTRKRVATASGNNWVVVGLAVEIPCYRERVICLPLLARLHLPGKKTPSPSELASEMVGIIAEWYPEREIVLIGDGAYSARAVLRGLPVNANYLGRVRSDIKLYDPQPPKPRKGQRGRKPTKGRRLPSPKQTAKKADRNRTGKGQWRWQEIEVCAYGVVRTLLVLSYPAVWPHVAGLRPLQIVVVRDPEGEFKDCYLCATDLNMALDLIVVIFAKRWPIEQAFRDSKQLMQIQAPKHWSEQSIKRLAPWVWMMQSLIILWYFKHGHKTALAQRAREQLAPWEHDYSFKFMLAVTREAVLVNTISTHSAQPRQLNKIIRLLKNTVSIAT